MLFFLLLGEKCFQFLFLIEVLYLVGHIGLKTWLIVYFESLIGRPDKFILLVRFFFN